MGVKQNVMHYISDVALYVMSSNYEGFPNALVEAMATGLPVISTDFPTGVAREVISNKNGWVIPVGDGDALLVAMETALSDESHWNEISLENRKLLEELSEARVVEKWKAVLFSTSE
jgi:glycosyltransferase involved in cell wall biosynthesis